jgi:hypothetical protein
MTVLHPNDVIAALTAQLADLDKEAAALRAKRATNPEGDESMLIALGKLLAKSQQLYSQRDHAKKQLEGLQHFADACAVWESAAADLRNAMLMRVQVQTILDQLAEAEGALRTNAREAERMVNRTASTLRAQPTVGDAAVDDILLPARERVNALVVTIEDANAVRQRATVGAA